MPKEHQIDSRPELPDDNLALRRLAVEAVQRVALSSLEELLIVADRKLGLQKIELALKSTEQELTNFISSFNPEDIQGAQRELGIINNRIVSLADANHTHLLEQLTNKIFLAYAAVNLCGSGGAETEQVCNDIKRALNSMGQPGVEAQKLKQWMLANLTSAYPYKDKFAGIMDTILINLRG